MRDDKIDILCIQETHLTNEHVTQIEALFARRLLVLNSSDPDRPGCSAGVAFVLNKETINISTAQMSVLIPGRAITLKLTWHNDMTIRLINVYAPNDLSTHPNFWKKIHTNWQTTDTHTPDFLLGDFNITEDAIDRAPARMDNEPALEALRDFRTALHLQDLWRHTYPQERLFTFNSNTNTLSRLDRIYVSPLHKHSISDWDAQPCIVASDHNLVRVRFAPTGLPHIGPGRWSWPTGLLNDPALLQSLITMGINAQREIEHLTARTDSTNPQTIWESLKMSMSNTVRKVARSNLAKINTRINTLKKDLKKSSNHVDIDTSNDLRQHRVLLEKELDHLIKKRYKSAHLKAQAQWTKKGETISKYWSRINSPKKPRDLIYKLRNPATNRLSFKSQEMAEIARDYHESLQQSTAQENDALDRNDCIKITINEIPDNQKIHDTTDEDLNHLLSEQHILNALYSSKAGSAAGIDGIPYEAWKIMHEHNKKASATDKPSFNVLKTLTAVINDIQLHGISKDTKFTLGWMCPLYKKNDRMNIENYRPITLLNTDYKLLTKALAMQLAHIIPSLIHPDQSGFIPNRSIFDPIRLAQSMIAYADIMEEDGIIVALDQEKAYDKIKHDYLFATLEKFNLPDIFINTIRALYKNAFTHVVINGFLSSPFQVTRGVRQGDPLSCLLFDLAIEPFACKLRNTPNLQGYNIPGLRNKIITSLYADDTTVYLRKGDKYRDLQDILQFWCKASGAKFNLSKTEILPIGSREHRETTIRNRRMNEDDDPWDENIRIASDGNPIRTLGAWIGNELDAATPWEPILDKITKCLAYWNLGHPTLDGKRLIIQMFVGGMTQFLTKAQGMPKQIENSLTKIIRNFIWDNARSPPMSLSRLQRPMSEGGINLLDIPTRNQAIEITWLSSYINMSMSRPSWAFATDAIINTLHPSGIKNSTDLNAFLTSWTPPSQGPRTKPFPREILSILKSAKRHKMSFAPLKLSQNLKEQLPAWLHLGAPTRTYNKRRDDCLQSRHKATSVKDLVSISRRTSNTQHLARCNCTCNPCKADRILGCKNPHKCATNADEILNKLHPKFNTNVPQIHDNLTLTHRRREKNTQSLTNNRGDIIFDPTITAKTSLSECFRIFSKSTLVQAPAYRLQHPRNGRSSNDEPITIYTDGSCINNGTANAKCGSGIWISDNHPLNKGVSVPGPAQSNQVGEIVAVLIAIQSISPLKPINIITDSKYVINGLTVHLKNWEDNGWIGIKNSEFFRATAYHLRKRSAPTTFQWVKGHSGIEGNEKADHLAHNGALKVSHDPIDLNVPANFDLQGAKLESITQSIAYQGLTSTTTLEYKRNTLALLDITRYALQETTNSLEHDAKIWAACRHPDLSKKIQSFIFKTLHNTYRIGSFWEQINNFSHRARCTACAAETESMEHILTECTNPTRTTIWNAAKQLWPSKHGNWPTISIGLILGCGAINIPHVPDENNPNDKAVENTKRGASRLLRIIISESAYLIWTLRCERVIQDKIHTPENISKRWHNSLLKRLQLDRAIASTSRRDGKFAATVKSTWQDIISEYNNNLQQNWVTALEVLVGITLPRPRSTDLPR